LSEELVREANDRLLRKLQEKGAPVDAIFFCPHHPQDNCDCRKPRTGMIRKAVQELKLDLKTAVVIGDKSSDVKLGKNIKAVTILVLTGYGSEETNKLKEENDKPDFVASDLLDAANWLKKFHHRRLLQQSE